MTNNEGRMLKRAIAGLALLLLGYVGAQAAEPIASLPYRIDYGGYITVQATIDGKGPYDFVIDTGSTLTLAFQHTADIQPFAPTGAPPIRVLGITAVEELDTFQLGAVRLGAASLEDHVGVILPDWEDRPTPDGIIGLDFLREYAIHFDNGSRTMTLYPHGGIPDERKRSLARVKLTPDNYGATSGALYKLQGRVNRKRVTFIVDLGSVSSLVNYQAAEAIYSSVVSRDLGEGFTTGSRLKDVFDDRTKARVARINRIQLGRISWRDRGVWIYDAPLFEQLNVQRLAYGLAGVDLLSDRDFALDFGESEMFIGR